MYAGNNPLLFSDPDGRSLTIVYDFAESGLSPQQQVLIARGVAQRFKNAGVEQVQTFLNPSLKRPRARTDFDRTIFIVLNKKTFKKSATAMGHTPAYPGNRSEVTMRHAPAASGQPLLNYAINVATHEGGHGTGALPQYDNDDKVLGSYLFPKNGEAGTVMEQGPLAPELGQQIREFSQSDAEALQRKLNFPYEPVDDPDE
jgi:hypothetical protein